MDGVTDLPVRLWLAATSCYDFAITPFLRLTTDYPLRRIPSTFCPDSQLKGFPPVRPQLMGSCPKTLARFSAHLLETHPVVDLNFGCPAPRVVGHRAGSALIEDRSVLADFLDSYFNLTPAGRTSIKTRLGFSSPHEASQLIEIFNNYPIHSLTLHGRTREQRYRGCADWNAIDRSATGAQFPVVASGDLLSAIHLLNFLVECPHAQAVLVGRGLLRNPWLLWEFRKKQPVCLEGAVLVKSLKVAALLFHLFNEGQDLRLLGEIGAFLGTKPDGRQSKTWDDFYKILDSEISSNERALQLSPSVLPRLKMLWNYLRTSLALEWDDPTILRSKTIGEFFVLLESKVLDFQTLVLEHRPHWDWRFSGEAKPL